MRAILEFWYIAQGLLKSNAHYSKTTQSAYSCITGLTSLTSLTSWNVDARSFRIIKPIHGCQTEHGKHTTRQNEYENASDDQTHEDGNSKEPCTIIRILKGTIFDIERLNLQEMSTSCQWGSTEHIINTLACRANPSQGKEEHLLCSDLLLCRMWMNLN